MNFLRLASWYNLSIYAEDLLDDLLNQRAGLEQVSICISLGAIYIMGTLLMSSL